MRVTLEISSRSGRDGHGVFLGLLVWFLTLVIFRGCLNNGFVNWDDPALVLNNASLQSFDLAGILRWFTSFDDGSYVPLSRLSLALDFRLWGRNPFGFHLTGLLLHSFNAVLVFAGVRLFMRWRNGGVADGIVTREVVAAAAACLWAFHPLRVESVAWVSERRDVLSGFFALLTLFFYLRGFGNPGASKNPGGSRGLVSVFFGCALLSKANAVPLPIFLVLLDFFPLGRIRTAGWRQMGKDLTDRIREKWLMFAMSLAAGGIAIYGQHLAGSTAGLGALGLKARLATMAVSCGGYLSKLLAPVNLNPLQLLNQLYSWRQTEVWLSASVLAFVSVLLFTFRRRCPVGLWAWLSFLVLIGPFLGFFQVGGALMADRYTYLAAAPLSMGAGVLVERLLLRGKEGRPPARWITGGALLLVLALLALGTSRQVSVWRDSEALWRQSLSLDAMNPFAWRNLADALHEGKKTDQALRCAREAVRLSPGDSGAWFDLGFFLQVQKQYPEALACYRRAVEILPSNHKAFHNLGWILAETGRLDEALTHYKIAWKLAPASETLFNIARCRERKGDVGGAIRGYREAALGGFDEAWIRWSQIVAAQGDEQQGMMILREGMRRSAYPRLRIALAEAILSLPNPQPDDLQAARELLAEMDQRNHGGSKKIADLLRRLDARSLP